MDLIDQNFYYGTFFVVARLYETKEILTFGLSVEENKPMRKIRGEQELRLLSFPGIRNSFLFSLTTKRVRNTITR